MKNDICKLELTDSQVEFIVSALWRNEDYIRLKYREDAIQKAIEESKKLLDSIYQQMINQGWEE